jgi:hypothetical protein
MATQNYFILTDAQRTAAVALNGEEYKVAPKAVDATNPGAGLNINDQANGVALGEAVTLTGKFVVPWRVVNDSDYQANVPDLVAYLLTLPGAMLEAETIFAPEE